MRRHHNNRSMENKTSYMSRNLDMEIESRVNTSRGELLAEEGELLEEENRCSHERDLYLSSFHIFDEPFLLFRTRLSGTH